MLIRQNQDLSGDLVAEKTGRAGVRVDKYGRVSHEPDFRPTFFDDFLGDVIADQWGVTKGSDAACVDFAVSADVNGKVLATTGAGAGASMAVNGVQLHSFLNWKASSGNLVFEARVKLAAITTVALYVGLTDQIAALEMPFTLGASDTLTSNATDGVGFLFDTAADTDTIWCVGVANDVDGTKVNTGTAPVADTYNVFRVEVTSGGLASFWLDDVLVATMASAVTPGVALTPVIAGFRRAASSTTIQADYVYIASDRV